MSWDEGQGALPKIGTCPVRYIKLGTGGSWEAAALDGGTLEWGSEIDTDLYARVGDWTGAREHYLRQRIRPATATSYVRELKDFFTLGADTLWITFARDRLWWAFAELGVITGKKAAPDRGAFYRRTIGPWRSTDLLGAPLIQSNLSSSLTKVAAYRQTMCKVADERYLFRLLNGEIDVAQAQAREALSGLLGTLKPIIQQLHWAEFELLIDLIFSRSGWRRISRLGGTLKDHDLILQQPLTGEKISVQVKSRADQATLRRYAGIFADNECDRLFFVTHNSEKLMSPNPATISVWSVDDIAEQTVSAGLADWLIERAA